MRKFTKRSAAVITAAVVAVGGGAAAWAAWTVSGTGSATVKAGSAVPVTIDGAALSGPLVPGQATGVKFNVKNPNAFKVRVLAGELGSFQVVDPSAKVPACGNDNFVFVNEAPFPATDVEPNGGSSLITWNGSIKLKPNPDNACQNANITFKIGVRAESFEATVAP